MVLTSCKWGQQDNNDRKLLTNGNMVVIIYVDQVTELQVTSKTGSFAGNTLHGTTITEEAVCVVVEEFITRLVEDGGAVSLGNSETDGIGETLTQRTSGDLNTGSVMRLGVTWRNAVELLLKKKKEKS